MRHDVQDQALNLLQASVRAHTSGEPHAPLMFVTQGCDGSTAILGHAYKILALHGVDPGPSNVQKELLDPKRNPYIKAANYDVVEAMKMLVDEHTRNHTTLVFKSIYGRDLAATLDSRLRQLGTMAVYNTRRNVLDRLVCMIRDCFVDTSADSMYGYPVDNDGKPSGLCFDRRDSDHSEGQEYRAILNISNIVINLNHIVQTELDQEAEIQNAGYEVGKAVYEDLVAFEQVPSLVKRPEGAVAGPQATQVSGLTPPRGLNCVDGDVLCSVQAWSDLLTFWGVQPNPSKIMEYLQKNAHTRPFVPTAKTVYNMKALIDAFDEHRKFRNLDMIRYGGEKGFYSSKHA